MGLFTPKKPAEKPYERAWREKTEQIRQIAQSRLGHYLASPFTAQCVSILREQIAAGKILRTPDDPIKVESAGIVSGYLGHTMLINFNAHGYNNLQGSEQLYGFIFAICQLLGSDYMIDFREHPYYDHIEPRIVRKPTEQHYRDI